MAKPSKKKYLTDIQLHAAMQEWADSFSKPPLRLWVKFDNADEHIVLASFKRWTKAKQYIAHDKKTYEVQVELGGYDPNFLEQPRVNTNRSSGVREHELKKMVDDWIKLRKLPVDHYFLSTQTMPGESNEKSISVRRQRSTARS